MAVSGSSRLRVSVDGKFFRLGEEKFFVKGVAYGPFAPNPAGQHFAPPEQTAADFEQIRSLGANLIRIYHVPDKWFLDLATEHKLKVLIDIPWNKHLCFLDTLERKAEAIDAVRRAVYGCARHPAVFAYSVANEIPADVVRWSGAGAVAEFIDELVLVAKRIDPECLCTYTNFPPTEFLHPQSIDFLCFNIYLHHQQPFRNYLSRLQMQADSKPLLLGEFGADSIRVGEAAKARMLEWQIEDTFRAGLAGCVVFSYTDDWWRGGQEVEDWQMGLTTRARQPKQSFLSVRKLFAAAPRFPMPRVPKVSVVVASYNGDRTLRLCLESLCSLNYPDYEVILVDDGSTDTTPQLAARHPQVKYIRHQKNLGLSAARNSGIAAAAGEIIAFTDSDCRADEDWLYFLVSAMLSGDFAGMGGPNLLPPEDSAVAAAVMVSPGGPAHVMLTDRQAEHIPGCNMAFYKWALEEIGLFDPIYQQAGDDVDLCWRLQQAGHKIGFSPPAFVWHYRRSTVAAYLKQQHGYGLAEALLVQKHPEYFNSLGASIWRGRIYAAAPSGLLRSSVIYRGLFGGAGYQSVYASQTEFSHNLATTLEYHLAINLPLWIFSTSFNPLLPVAIASSLVSLGVCTGAALQAPLPRNRTLWWSRPLVALLFLLQPIVRGWARYQGRITFSGKRASENLDSMALRNSRKNLRRLHYWSEKRFDRVGLVGSLIEHLELQGWSFRADTGWSDFDVEIYGSRWSNLQLVTAAEEHPRGKQMLCCQLRSRWSLPARMAFFSLLAFELLLLGLAGGSIPWLWLILLTIPAMGWFFHRDQRRLKSVVIVMLDKFAKEHGLVRGRKSKPEPKARVVARPARPEPATR